MTGMVVNLAKELQHEQDERRAKWDAQEADRQRENLRILNTLSGRDEWYEVLAWFPYRTALVTWSADTKDPHCDLDRSDDKVDEMESKFARLAGKHRDNHTACVVRRLFSRDIYAIMFSDQHTRISTANNLHIGNY